MSRLARLQSQLLAVSESRFAAQGDCHALLQPSFLHKCVVLSHSPYGNKQAGQLGLPLTYK